MCRLLPVLAGRNEQIRAQEIDRGPVNADVLLFAAYSGIQGDLKLGKMIRVLCQDDFSQPAFFIRFELVQKTDSTIRCLPRLQQSHWIALGLPVLYAQLENRP